MRHFLNMLDLSPEELRALLADALQMKQALQNGQRPPVLAGRVLALIFEKPSLRTRASFEAAMAQMGGSSIFLSASDGKLGVRESVPDFARTLSEYVDAVVLRTYKHETIEEFAHYASVPVINGLSDRYHPCQALGDLMTIQETFGSLEGRTLAFIGDGNNVARSVAIGCGKLGMHFVLAAPSGYAFDEEFMESYRQKVARDAILQNGAPEHAVESADVVYTDVWTSMGQEEESDTRRKQFASYQVNTQLLSHAPPHCRIMHCLPAHRGEEVSEDILESEKSIVFQQAGNRMHAQKALLKWLILGK
jgi:ornithine carbamoyltransferase